MAGSPVRRSAPPQTPSIETRDAFRAETRKMPADVMRAVMREVEQRLPTPPGATPAPRLEPPLRHPPSGTRRRVTPEEIASFLSARDTPLPTAESLHVQQFEIIERIEELPELEADDVEDEQPTTVTLHDEPQGAPRKRVQFCGDPMAALPKGMYPAPRIALAPRPLLDQPHVVFLMSMAAVIVVLGPLVYLLLG